ncbi:MAG: class I SAM-dependent methyltransferase [Candidatus Omnitrophota bacterium]|nr:class I SAM-dependent methyltransferase [Candidatus Omnitrophota bacterium]
MKEVDIRPAHLADECQKLFEKESRSMLQSERDFVEVSCPACSSVSGALDFTKGGYQFKKCAECRTVYVSPRPTAEMLGEYYRNNAAAHFWQTHIFPQTEKARLQGIHRPRIDLVLNEADKNGAGGEVFVEVGAGSGIFGRELAKRNRFKKVVLIEPGPMNLESSGVIEVINSSIEEVNVDLKADMAVNFELIEHLFSPDDFLSNISRSLNPGGLFLFTTPNMEGLELLTLYEKSPGLVAPNHLNNFNRDSIRTLVERNGFEVVSVSTPGELDCDIVRNKHLEGVIDLSTQPFLKHVLIDRPEDCLGAFQQFLKESGLSSHMMVVVRKP